MYNGVRHRYLFTLMTSKKDFLCVLCIVGCTIRIEICFWLKIQVSGLKQSIWTSDVAIMSGEMTPDTRSSFK